MLFSENCTKMYKYAKIFSRNCTKKIVKIVSFVRKVFFTKVK